MLQSTIMKRIIFLLLPVCCGIMLYSGCDESLSPGNHAPVAPTGLTAVPLSDNSVQLTWIDTSFSGSEYRIERSSGVGSDWFDIAQVEAELNTYIDTVLDEGTEYRYRVRSCQDAKVSEPSEIVTVTTLPKAPVDLSIVSISASTISMTWLDFSEIETNYEIWRRRGYNGRYDTVFMLPKNVSAYRDTALMHNTRYFYCVRATLDTIASLWSDEVGAATSTAPTDLIAWTPSDSIVWLSWRDNSEYETGFLIERAQTGAETLRVGLDRNTRSFADVLVSEGNFYRYRVRALFDDAVSPPTETVAVRTPPKTPTELEAVKEKDSNTIILISWNETSLVETGFELQRRIPFATDFDVIAEPGSNQTSLIDTVTALNTEYVYRVRALLDTIASNWSNTDTIRTTVLTPSRPTELLVEALSVSQVRLSWSDNSYNELGFVVERLAPEADDWAVRDSLSANIVRCYDTQLITENTYSYRVYAYNEYGNSLCSNIFVITIPQDVPAPPSELREIEVTYSMVSMTWQDNSHDELGFRIARRLFPWSQWIYAGETDVDNVTFADTTVLRNETYAYRVNAFNEAGESDWSGQLIVTIPDGPPDAPQYLHARALFWDAIHLTWTRGSDNEAGFRIERRLPEEGEFSLIAETGYGEVAYRDDSLSAETMYLYRVKAFNDYGESGYSNVDSVLTLPRIAFQDDFESYGVGMPPGGEGWSYDRTGSSFVAVTDRDAHEGSKSVLFYDPAGADSSYCMLSTRFEPVGLGEVNCWLKIASNGYFGVMGGDDRDYVTFMMQFHANNTIRMLDGNVFINIDGYPVDEWFQLKIDFDTSQRYYRVAFNGQVIADSLSLQRSDHQGICQLLFMTYINQNLTNGYLDDLFVRDVDATSGITKSSNNGNFIDDNAKKLIESDLDLRLR